MKGRKVGEISRKFFGSWSIEPAFILFYLGYTIKTGAGIVEQLILDKVMNRWCGVWKCIVKTSTGTMYVPIFQACLYTLNYNESICANLTAEENVDYEVEVQGVANRFNFVATLLQVGTCTISLINIHQSNQTKILKMKL